MEQLISYVSKDRKQLYGYTVDNEGPLEATSCGLCEKLNTLVPSELHVIRHLVRINSILVSPVNIVQHANVVFEYIKI